MRIAKVSESTFQRMKDAAACLPCSLFAKMHSNLQGYTVLDRETGNEVPKYILWEICGKTDNEDYQLINELNHPDYIFLKHYLK